MDKQRPFFLPPSAVSSFPPQGAHLSRDHGIRVLRNSTRAGNHGSERLPPVSHPRGGWSHQVCLVDANARRRVGPFDRPDEVRRDRVAGRRKEKGSEGASPQRRCALTFFPPPLIVQDCRRSCTGRCGGGGSGHWTLCGFSERDRVHGARQGDVLAGPGSTRTLQVCLGQEREDDRRSAGEPGGAVSSWRHSTFHRSVAARLTKPTRSCTLLWHQSTTAALKNSGRRERLELLFFCRVSFPSFFAAPFPASRPLAAFPPPPFHFSTLAEPDTGSCKKIRRFRRRYSQSKGRTATGRDVVAVTRKRRGRKAAALGWCPESGPAAYWRPPWAPRS